MSFSERFALEYPPVSFERGLYDGQLSPSCGQAEKKSVEASNADTLKTFGSASFMIGMPNTDGALEQNILVPISSMPDSCDEDFTELPLIEVSRPQPSDRPAKAAHSPPEFTSFNLPAAVRSPDLMPPPSISENSSYYDNAEDSDEEACLLVVHDGDRKSPPVQPGFSGASTGSSTTASNGSRIRALSPSSRTNSFLEDDYSTGKNLEENEEEEELAGLLSRRSIPNSSYWDGWNQMSRKSKQEDNGLEHYVTKERARGMEKIKQQAAQVLHVFKELNSLVHEQQDDFDLLDTTMLNIKASTKGAVDELKRANMLKQQARRRKLFFVVVTVVVGMIVFGVYMFQSSPSQSAPLPPLAQQALATPSSPAAQAEDLRIHSVRHTSINKSNG